VPYCDHSFRDSAMAPKQPPVRRSSRPSQPPDRLVPSPCTTFSEVQADCRASGDAAAERDAREDELVRVFPTSQEAQEARQVVNLRPLADTAAWKRKFADLDAYVVPWPGWRKL
jgi:hypothetical protein